VARAIINAESLPSYAQGGNAERISSFGFEWKFIAERRLGDVAQRVQVRTIAQLAPPKETSKYAQDMRRGDQFPPIIITADGYLVDGSTRTEAARKVGWTTFPAFELDVLYKDAPESVRKQLIALGAGFNATHGRRMSPQNFKEIVETISVEDDTVKDIAKRLHIPESTANTLLNAAKAQHRAERLGVTLDGSLTNSHLRLFGGKSQQFTDPVFAALITLTQDAKLTIPMTTDLMKRLSASGTERERLALLDGERRDYRSIIEGASLNPSRAAKLRQSLGFLNGVRDADTLAEQDPHAARTHIKVLKEAMFQLERVIDAQTKVEQTRA
jgi:hypothetical protein